MYISVKGIVSPSSGNFHDFAPIILLTPENCGSVEWRGGGEGAGVLYSFVLDLIPSYFSRGTGGVVREEKRTYTYTTLSPPE